MPRRESSTRFAHPLVNKYLQKYAESGAIDTAYRLQQLLPEKRWRYGVLIPICGESVDVPERVFADCFSETEKGLRHDVLVVICLNRPDEHPRADMLEKQNRHWLRAQKTQSVHAVTLSSAACWLAFANRPDMLVVIRNEANNPQAAPLPRRQAVGLARKLAADTLLALIQARVIEEPWLFSTDADARLPQGYFQVLNTLSPAVAASLSFCHEANIQSKTQAGEQGQKLIQAQKYYTLRLHLYRKGLEQINPRYAWIPLGSTLVIAANAYAMVRGFPKRAAGEDFYLLNKLSKIGNVVTEEKRGGNDIREATWPCIQLQTRDSDRVPFGTGPAVRAIAAMEHPEETYGFYHPDIFPTLSLWRTRMRQWLASKQYSRSPSLPDDVLTGKLHGLNAALCSALPVKQFVTRLHAQNIAATQRLRQFDEWLDAFRLLKAVHAAESLFPRLSLKQLAENDCFTRCFLTDKNVAAAFHDLWPIA